MREWFRVWNRYGLSWNRVKMIGQCHIMMPEGHLKFKDERAASPLLAYLTFSFFYGGSMNEGSFLGNIYAYIFICITWLNSKSYCHFLGKALNGMVSMAIVNSWGALCATVIQAARNYIFYKNVYLSPQWRPTSSYPAKSNQPKSNFHLKEDPVKWKKHISRGVFRNQIGGGGKPAPIKNYKNV